MACNYDPDTNIDNGSCTYADEGYDCEGNCISTNIDWIGDQDGNGYTSIDPATGDLYITIESFPNVGSAIITINGEEFPMEYTDWGTNAHWYYSMTTEPDSDYNWNVTVSNICAISQSYSDNFSTDCENIANGSSEDEGCGCGEPAALFGYDCDGNCILDENENGICDGDELEGCMDPVACNYDPNANIDNGSCIYVDLNLFNDTTLCSSEILELNIDGTYESYFWSNGSSESSIEIYNSGTYFVTINDEFGCQITDTFNVDFSPLPFIDLGDEFVLCSNSPIFFDISEDWESVLWVNNITNDTISEDYSVNIDQAGSYKIIVTDSFSCSGIDIIDIIEILDPIAFFEVNYLDNNLFTDNFSLNSDYFTWHIFSHNNSVIDTSINLSLKIELCENDTIMLVSYNECGSDTMIHINNPTYLTENDIQTLIYPNPFVDKIHIEKPYRYNHFAVQEINGRILQKGRVKEIINLDILSSGIYQLILFNENYQTIKKIIKK